MVSFRKKCSLYIVFDVFMYLDILCVGFNIVTILKRLDVMV